MADIPLTINDVSSQSQVEDVAPTCTRTLYVSDNGTPWQCPPGAKNLVVECWGAGGSGGGHNWSQDGGSGAGGGAYSKKTIANPSGNYAFDVGDKGLGVVSANGVDGGDTWFLANGPTGCVAKGGKKGLYPTGPGMPGGAGGLASEGYGDVKYDGGWGEWGNNSVSGRGGWGGSSGGTASDGHNNGSSPAWTTITYPTGSTPAGAGHGGNGGDLSQNGSAPVSGNGGGGGGAGEGTARKGGDGADGKIILTWEPPQGNVIYSDNLVSQSNIGDSSISVIRQLAINSVYVQSSIEAAGLGLLRNIAVQNIEVASSVADVFCAPTVDLQIQNVSSQATIETVAVDNFIVLTTQNISASSSMESVAVTKTAQLSVSDILASSAIENSLVNKETTLNLVDVTSQAGIDAAQVGKLATISPEHLYIGSSVGQPLISRPIYTENIASATSIESVSVSRIILGTMGVHLPSLEIEASGVTGEESSSILFIPALSATAAGIADGIGSGSAAIPKIIATANGIAGFTGTGAGMVSAITAIGGDTDYSGAAICTLAEIELSAILARGIIGSGGIQIRAPTLAAAGLNEGDCEGSFTLPKIALSASGGAGVAAAIELELPSLFASGTGQGPANTGTADITLPIIELAGTGVENVTASAYLELPALQLEGIIATSLAYQFMLVNNMNLRRTAVSDYDNFDFNSYCPAGDNGYAAREDGIYELVGPQDETDSIEAEIRKLSMDLNNISYKRMTDAYLQLQSNGPYRILLFADDESVELSVNDNGNGIHAKKINLPRGFGGNGIGFGLKFDNTDFLLNEAGFILEMWNG